MSLPGCGKIRTSTSKAVQHSSLGILLTSLGFVLIPQQRAQLLLRLQATLVSGPSHPVRPAAVARSTTCRWQTPFNLTIVLVFIMTIITVIIIIIVGIMTIVVVIISFMTIKIIITIIVLTTDYCYCGMIISIIILIVMVIVFRCEERSCPGKALEVGNL